jgi:A/G-specific adenine glycosylase
MVLPEVVVPEVGVSVVVAPDFSEQLLSWFDRYGRKDLPWQKDSTPYRVWISEIMLQQTRVETVIAYYQRFLQRFPAVADLADASEDQVLHYWAGLGYYARARNLHQTANVVQNTLSGEFPDTLEGLMQLPGIGRSTAAAILSLASDQKAAVLDGNVRRLLARFHVIEGWTGQAKVQRQLWAVAERHLPRQRFADYTQAIMDLGAIVCRRNQPDCTTCPVSKDCQARAKGRTDDLPTPKPKLKLPVRSVQLLLLENPQGELLLERRPSHGIWGGLWSFPECHAGELESCCTSLGVSPGSVEATISGAQFRHTFTHFHLDITPVHVQLKRTPSRIAESGQRYWYDPGHPAQIGLAAPVARLINSLRGVTEK